MGTEENNYAREAADTTALEILVTSFIRVMSLKGHFNKADIDDMKQLCHAAAISMKISGQTSMQVGGERIQSRLRSLFSILEL